MPDASFYARTASGDLACRLCHALHGRHEPDCPLIVLHVRVQELGGQLGLYVATMREVIESVEAMLRGEPSGDS
jgi:hypothetical protein